ncbi:hypothetical protein EV281_11215 [Rhizobium sp. BK418]|nr:hypothetical protein EV281_11215 [Rhizobium sp. BK418]
MLKSANTKTSITLSTIIEFCAWLSIVTIVSGYIWINVILYMADITAPLYFTISDYVAHGASPGVLFLAIPFAGNLTHALQFEGDEPKGLNHAIGISIVSAAIILLVLILIAGATYFSTPTHRIQPLGILRSFSGLFVFLGLVFVSHVLVPIRFNLVSVALVCAAAIWLYTGTIAASYVDRFNKPIPPDSVQANFLFDGAEFSLSSWYPLLATDRYYIFMDRNTRLPVVMDAGALKRVNYLPRVP